MKVVVMGAGGVGGYFGGLLAKAGHDVTFIARGSHLGAIQSDGLKIISDLSGNFTVYSDATDDPRTLGFVDLIIFTVKTYHNAAAIPLISPLVGPNTVVLTLQNGVDSSKQLADVLGYEHVLTGVAYVQSIIENPGVISQIASFGRIVFGEMIDKPFERTRKIHDEFTRAGWNVELTNFAAAAIWRKFIPQCAIGSIDALSQTTVGEIRTTPETRGILASMMRENIDIARAKEIGLEEDILEKSMAALDAFPADGRTSLAKDYREGKQIEIEALPGATVRMGLEANVPTPITEMIYGLLKPAGLRSENG